MGTTGPRIITYRKRPLTGPLWYKELPQDLPQDIPQNILKKADEKYSEVKRLYIRLYKKMAGISKTLDIKKRIGIHETELIPNDIQVGTYKRTTTQNESWEDQTVIQDSAKYLIPKLEKMFYEYGKRNCETLRNKRYGGFFSSHFIEYPGRYGGRAFL